MAATTSLASRDEIPRKRGSTPASFSGVRTRDSSPTTVKQSRPSRSADSTLGNRGSSRAAACRYQAALLERPSSRVRKAKRLACPSRSQPRRRSKSARASRKSAAASCSRRNSRARSSRRARASASVSGGTRSAKPRASQALTGSWARSGALEGAAGRRAGSMAQAAFMRPLSPRNPGPPQTHAFHACAEFRKVALAPLGRSAGAAWWPDGARLRAFSRPCPCGSALGVKSRQAPRWGALCIGRPPQAPEGAAPVAGRPWPTCDR
jgi:hypothetical protein